MCPDEPAWVATPAAALNVLTFGAIGDGIANDTAPVQAAINAASAAAAAAGAAWVDLLLPSGHTFLLDTITPKSNVRIWAYGATIQRTSATFGLFFENAAALSKFEIRGGYYPGSGTETQNQTVFYYQGSAGADINIYDTFVTNWGSGPFRIGNTSRTHVERNTLLTVGNAGGALTNAINFVFSSNGAALAEIWCRDNYVDNCAPKAIAIVNSGNAASTTLRAVITGNDVKSTSTAPTLGVEWSSATEGEASTVNISGNTVTYSGATAAASAIQVADAGSPASDPLLLNRVLIANNVVDSTQQGIVCNASYALITGNQVTATQLAVNAQGVGTFAATGATANASNQVTGVSAPAGVVNGSIVTGTNIPSGTFIVSGAGTGTWTLSQNATGANAGLTVISQLVGVNITNNVLHALASPSNHVLQGYALRNSIIQGNNITTDSGSANTNGNGMGFQFCGWVDILDNTITYAAGYGIRYEQGNDFRIERNRVYNPSEGGTLPGIRYAAVSGTLCRIASNVIIDDRAAHKMTFGVLVGAGVPAALGELLSNEIQGAATGPTSGTFFRKRDNFYSAGASEGRATLVAGTVTVNTAEIQASDNVILTVVAPAGTRGEVQLGTITAGTSFVINSIQPGTASTLQGADTSVVYWRIDH